MGGFDWIIAAIFLISMLVGVMRGFIKESLSIISWIAAIWLATSFCVEAGDFIAQYIDIPNQKFRTWAGFGAIFISTLFLFAIISYGIVKLFLHGAIKGTDRVLGVGFGALRAAAIVVAIIIVARGLGMSNTDWWKDSHHLHRFEPVSNYVEAMLPEEWQSEPVDEAEEAESTIEGKVLEGLIDQFQSDSSS